MPTNEEPTAAPKRNVLYIVIDDLRPEMEAYGSNKVYRHPMRKLAASSVTFKHAYCQIAVCSPSRQSFLTGRRPDRASIYNFIDHFRQADCGKNFGGQRWVSGRVVNQVQLKGSDCGWASPDAVCGGSGTCRTLCTESSECDRWNFYGKNSTCVLIQGGSPSAVQDESSVAGLAGNIFYSCSLDNAARAL